MAKYCLNINAHSASGEHGVHQTWPRACGFLPETIYQIDLGEHINCHSAVLVAKGKFPDLAEKIDGCYFCCRECHRVL